MVIQPLAQIISLLQNIITDDNIYDFILFVDWKFRHIDTIIKYMELNGIIEIILISSAYMYKWILYVYLFQKAKRRTQALEELQKRGWQTEQRRNQIRKILNVDLTSSDEECDDGFITHPPSWQSDIFAKVKSKLDRIFLETCSTKSRRLLQKRTIGSSHVKPIPNYPEECSWIVNQD